MIPHKIAHWKSLLDNQKIRFCGGSGSLFKKQHELQANGYDDHEQWLVDFRNARSDEFFFKGSKEEGNGNQMCQLLAQQDGCLSVKIRCLNGLEGEFGKHLTINGLSFSYKGELALLAMARNEERKDKSKNLSSLYSRHQANILAMKEAQQLSVQKMQERGDSHKELAERIGKQKGALEKFSKPTKNNLLTDFGQALFYRFKRDAKG